MGWVLINFTLLETLFVVPLKLSGPLIMRIMGFSSLRSTVLRLMAAFPPTLALIGSAWAVPVSGAGAPFQADLPAGWAQ